MAVAVAHEPATVSAGAAGSLDAVAPLTVSVWTVDLDQPLAVVDALRGSLDDGEVRAAAARRDDTVRNRYVVAHGATRSILGARLGVAPDAVEISRRCARCGDPAHGKPEVVAPGGLAGEQVSFSLSHSEALAAVAVVSGARVGIDIEVERPRVHLAALAARVLGAEAHADWLALSPDLQLHAFLEEWTAKEAYLKAIGAGITVPLRDVPVEPEGWTVTGFATPPGVVVRVAVEGYAVAHVERWVPPAVAPRVRDANRPIDKFRGTAVGSVLAAGLLGLRDALEPAREEEVAIVQNYSGDPPFTEPLVLRLDPEHPEDSIVMVRPWLRDAPRTPLPGDTTPNDPPAPTQHPSITESERPSPN
jgi:4'-phosphopantetheinyl transferase